MMLFEPTKAGLYCPQGDFYIDPMRKVHRAVITHAHADHAIRGHEKVLATQPTLDAMRIRYGKNFAGQTQALAYGDVITLNGVRVSLIPAGHILGSAQVVVEQAGQRAIAAGDYKRAPDPTATPFEVQSCDLFVTEATFGVPLFHHPDPMGEVQKLLTHRAACPHRPHIINAYSLGKAQRMIALLRQAGVDETLVVHKSALALCEMYETHGISMGPLVSVDQASEDQLAKGFILAPVSVAPDGLFSPVFAFASGWNSLRKRRSKPQEGHSTLPLIISDHADWGELTQTISEVAPEHLWVTYGQEDALIHAAQQQGITAQALRQVREGGE